MRRIHMSRRYASRRHAAGGLGPSRVRTRIPTTRRLGQWVSLRKILRFRVWLQLSQSRCLSLLLAMSGRAFLFFPPRGHEPPPTLRDRLNQTSAFNAIVFQSPVMPNARMSLCTQSVHSSFSFPPRPLRTAPSRFPNMIRFGNRPPLIRGRSVPAHKSLLVRNVVSMLSHRVISRARLYDPVFMKYLYYITINYLFAPSALLLRTLAVGMHRRQQSESIEVALLDSLWSEEV